jgi:hypothetical protein
VVVALSSAILLSIYWKCAGGGYGQFAEPSGQGLPVSPERAGLSRYEVLGLSTDRELIRSLARRLAEDSPEASRLRVAVAGEPSKKGGILAELRRSPLVGAGLNLTRPRDEGRKIEL